MEILHAEFTTYKAIAPAHTIIETKKGGEMNYGCLLYTSIAQCIVTILADRIRDGVWRIAAKACYPLQRFPYAYIDEVANSLYSAQHPLSQAF